MSLISVLGFRPSSSSSSSESTHWAILISPHPPSAKTQKSKSRFFRPKITIKEPRSDSALFDMKRHQLRQQQFPIPLKEAENSTESTNRPSETPSEQVAITTLDAECSHPLPLILQISASILAQTPQRLIPRLSQRLYHTPTYGSEDDWLRAALSLMHDILLEPGFDVDRFVEYATSAAKEYTMYEASSEEQDNNEDRPVQQQSDTETEYSAVLTLDYTAHLAQNASVKAMLNREPQQQLTPPESPRLQHVKQEQQQRLGEGQGQKKPRTWLGFRISTSPNAQSRRTADRYSFERQDDPYGGLM